MNITELDLSISIVSYNDKDLLQKCLASVFEQTSGITFEVFVVDNASKDGSQEMVRTEFPQVKLIENIKNYGFPTANNQALKKAKGKYFLLLNPDTVILDNALTKLTHSMNKTPNCGVCCPQLLYPDGRLQKSYSKFWTPSEYSKGIFNPQINELRSIFGKAACKSEPRTDYFKIPTAEFPNMPIEVERPRGPCFLVRMDAIRQVGPMDERFFIYQDEVDWALRIRGAAWVNYFVPEAHVVHIWGASTTLKKKRLYDDIHTQSDYKYFYKHFGFSGKTAVWLAYLINGILALVAAFCILLLNRSAQSRSRAKGQFKIAKESFRKLFLLKEIRIDD